MSKEDVGETELRVNEVIEQEIENENKLKIDSDDNKK